MAPARRELSLNSRRPTTTFVFDRALARRARVAKAIRMAVWLP
jgi:hypothetical protein